MALRLAVLLVVGLFAALAIMLHTTPIHSSH